MFFAHEVKNMNKQQKEIINICVWGTIVFFVLRCMIDWKSILKEVSIYNLYGYAGEAFGVAAIFTGIYEKTLWRLNPFEKFPKLAKRYHGTLKSSYYNIERNGTLEIKQTLLSIQITLITSESRSTSFVASIDDIYGEMKLTYIYLNTPQMKYSAQSVKHFGTAVFSLNDPMVLEGQYYTDRKTVGDMTFIAEK